MFASRFSWLMVVKEERRFTGRARVLRMRVERGENPPQNGVKRAKHKLLSEAVILKPYTDTGSHTGY